MSDTAAKGFDLREARAELRELRRRAKTLERGIAKHVEAQLTAMLLAIGQARDGQKLLAAARAFLDEAEEA